MVRQTVWRLVCLSVVVVAGVVFATGAASPAPDSGTPADLHTADVGDVVAPPRNGTTVVATDSNTWLGRASSGPRASAELLAIGPDGVLQYDDDSHTRYWDVDPVPGTDATVEYLYADHLNASECGGESVCTRNGVERANLTTGEVTDVYHRVTPGKHSTRWHDADRINDTRIVVADIARDRVFVVDTETELVVWAWSAQSEFPVDESGGPYPSDWTHLNDVEVLPDGRLAVSLRNHDQVVFLDRERGLDEAWTLGRDGDHSRLYEQHNPDFIPAERGGPSLLVADSENRRVVEYRRSDGSWNRTWTWQDARLQWPRDADRLPNGHTLVTDSNGDRVLEVGNGGEVVWQLEVAFPYEAERLGTGDESTGGPASDRAGLTSSTVTGSSARSVSEEDDAGTSISGIAPVLNAVHYVLPVWMEMRDLLALVVFCLGSLAWGALEWRWADLAVTVRSPLRVRRKR